MTSRMEQELQSLRTNENSQRRGYRFQEFIAELFRAAQFEVTPNAGAAKPRQTDLVARRGADGYLVETKWEKKKASSADIDALLSRLRRTSNELTGVFFSNAGYTTDAVELVRHERARPILLFEGSELDRLVQDDRVLLQLLRQKRDQLVTNCVVQRNAPARRSRRRKSVELPSSTLSFLGPNDGRSSVFVCSGEYNKSAFVMSLPDIDWLPGEGRGVTLDVSLQVHGESGLIDLFGDLAAMGWIRQTEYLTQGVACWSIQQATTNWHGHGCDEFVKALTSWRQRYKGIPSSDLHHTEEFTYFDTCRLGYFSLTGQVSADRRRIVWQPRVSFQLMGIPVDDGAIRQFCDRFGDDDTFYRPRTSESVKRVRLPEPRDVTPISLVVQPMDGEDWVVGIVIENPYRGRGFDSVVEGDSPWLLHDSANLLCDLGQWHPLKKKNKRYYLRSLEWSVTSETTVVHPVADWDDPAPRSKRTKDLAPRSVRKAKTSEFK